MQKGYTGSDRRIAYLFDHATETSAEQVLVSGTKIATVTIDGQEIDLYAPEGTEVTITQVQASGNKIADITVNNATTGIYAPKLTVASGKVSL